MSNIFSPCGIHCNSCPWFKGEMEPKCPGCTEIKGKPFWGKCETHACVQDHGIVHCGECTDFPCKDFMSRYDPREGPENALMRVGLLAYCAKYGDEAALKLLHEAESYETPA